MRFMRLGLALATLSLALPACASYDRGYRSGYASLDYDAYYDDAYGPFYDGYWGDDGGFYYRSGRGRPFGRDGGDHFHHSPGGGFHGVHSSGGFHGGGHAGGGHGGGRG
jgi:hypothetical protein